MLEQLVIRITDTDSLDAQWLALDARGNRVGFPQQGHLNESVDAAHNRRVVVLLPGEHIIAAAARVPGGNARRIMQAAPYALEDRLAGDVEQLQVVLIAREADQLCRFLVVDRPWLADMLGRIEAEGIVPDALWPDYLAVPGDDDSEHWLLTRTEALLARHGHAGFSAPAADAPLLYQHREDDELPLRLAVVGDQPAPVALGELETTRYADNERVLTEMAATIAARDGNGLLQGEFRRQREGGIDWQRWRWPGIAAGALIAMALAHFAVDTWRLQREHAFLQQATRDLFQRALPDSRQIPGQERFLVEQALGQANTGDNHLLEYIGNVASALQKVPGSRLNAFNFRNDAFEFSVTVPDAAQLEQLRNQLAEQPAVNVDVQSANNSGNGLEGRLLVRTGASQ